MSRQEGTSETKLPTNKSEVNVRAFPDQNTMRKEYDELLEKRVGAMNELQALLEKALSPMSSLPAVRTRVKGFTSFFKKYIGLLDGGLLESRLPEGSKLPNAGEKERVPHITDIIGMRIVCPFMEDLSSVETILKENFEIIEVERKGRDHSFREFGYESVHLLIKLPENLAVKYGPLGCEVAEIQIRTILQDAWAEVEHELVYKAEFNPFDEPLKRKLAAVNASLSLADIVFQEIRGYLRNLHGELGKRRESFFRKIEASTDALLFEDRKTTADKGEEIFELETIDTEAITSGAKDYNESIDDLLLEALTAHNKNRFAEAIARYTQILELNPDDMVTSLILKHRGMAYFARSHYEDAIVDFRKSLELDPKSYKSAYYEGIIRSVLKEYTKALDAFNFSLKINPYQPYCLYRRGQAYFHLEDFPQALADCEAAITLESFEGAHKFRQLVLDKLKM